MSLESMTENLKTSLKALEDAQKLQGTMADDLIEQLPDNMKAEAVRLIGEARNGKVDAAELIKFSSGVRDINKEEFDKTVEAAVERVKQKEKEVSKE